MIEISNHDHMHGQMLGRYECYDKQIIVSLQHLFGTPAVDALISLGARVVIRRNPRVHHMKYIRSRPLAVRDHVIQLNLPNAYPAVTIAQTA